MQQHLTRIEQANLIAGHAVSYATAYLDGRHNAQQLAQNASHLERELLGIGPARPDPVRSLLDSARMLCGLMEWTARSAGDVNLQGRLRKLMLAFVDFIREQSLESTKDHT